MVNLNDIFHVFTAFADAFLILNDIVMDLELYIGTHHISLYTLMGVSFVTALLHILCGTEVDSDFDAVDFRGYGGDDW